MSQQDSGTAATVPQAVCLGESMAVLLPDRAGPLDAVGAFRATVGGAESNVACALAALGVRSAWVSRVGDDGFGRELIAQLVAHGVDISSVSVDPHRRTGLYLKEVGGSAHPEDVGAGRSRLHYYRSGSAAATLSPGLLADQGFLRLLADARLLHLTGITPALSDDCLALVRALLAQPRAGRLISFDLNWRPVLWHGRDPGVLPGLLDAADLLLLGADEAEDAFGTGDPQALRAMFPSPATVVVKDSGHLVTALADGTAVTEPALTVDVVEPTGAGDAFAAGYLAGTLRGLDQRRRLRLGHLTAACALTSPGDQGGVPPEATIAALLDATAEEWAATRVSADGIVSPVPLPPAPARPAAPATAPAVPAVPAAPAARGVPGAP